MLILFDFKCTTCDHRIEKLVKRDIREVECPECGGTMARCISPIRSSLEGLSGHFPDAADKWARRHEKEGRKPSETNPDGW